MPCVPPCVTGTFSPDGAFFVLSDHNGFMFVHGVMGATPLCLKEQFFLTDYNGAPPTPPPAHNIAVA